MSDTAIPPLIFPAKSRAERLLHKQWKDKNQIRLIGPRLYTSAPESEVAALVRGNCLSIIGNLFPRVLLSHRSALEYKPTPDGTVYITSNTNRVIRYPGLTLKFLRGPKALPDDPKILSFHASSTARAFLENLTSTRLKTAIKVVPQKELERRIEEILLNQGEERLNELRDRAREISAILHLEKEFVKLDKIIGAMLGTTSSRSLESELARARSKNKPYDQKVFIRLQLLFGELRQQPFELLNEAKTSASHFNNKAFIESYFSNYIEGTTFEIEEAAEIIFDKKIPKNRPKDAHDIIGTYKLVSDPNEMGLVPKTDQSLLDLLKNRHAVLMQERPEAMPGQFKEEPNRAGATSFVHPDYVLGTLMKGFELYQDLPAGISRAIYIMFLISEVHPFVDGNGRIARIMMNAELYSQQLSTIIIPNVYRTDYLGALRALSRQERTNPLVKMLVTAQKFSRLDFSSYPLILKELRRRNWFAEPEDAKIIL